MAEMTQYNSRSDGSTAQPLILLRVVGLKSCLATKSDSCSAFKTSYYSLASHTALVNVGIGIKL